jgi:hypothetical protein
MQPYFFPYIGYFQLINAVDSFVLYDDIQYTKKGWINRNRILQNGRDCYVTLPLKKASDYLDVNERYLADTWPKEHKKLIDKLINCYRKAPYFNEVFPVIEQIIKAEHNNLFDYLYNSLIELVSYLNINTDIVVSSTLNINNALKGEQKVIEICETMKATHYINSIGGMELYGKNTFAHKKINLHFLKSNNIKYLQLNNDFVPWLSIIDVLMFNSLYKIQSYLYDDFSLT